MEKKFKSRIFNLVCITCDRTFQAKTSNVKYCSDECKPKAKCFLCGEEFILLHKRVGRQKVFCSRSCSTKYQMNNLTDKQRKALSENGRRNIQKANEYWKTEEGRERKSKICAKTNSTPERAELVKKQWENEDYRNKMAESVKRRWKDGVYGNLAIDNLKKINLRIEKYCKKCQKATTHNYYNCLTCKPPAGGRNFGDVIITTKLGRKISPREQFYSEQLSLIKLNGLSEITVSDISEFNKIPGVWAIWNAKDNICLQVGQNLDIGKELFRQIRLLTKYGVEDWINDHDNAEYFHTIGRYYYDKELNFRIIKSNIEDKEERLIIEMQYAHDNKAKYWSPEPGQMSLLKGENKW